MLSLGVDDITGEPLVQQEDDRPEAVAARLRQYKEVAKPVIELYKVTPRALQQPSSHEPQLPPGNTMYLLPPGILAFGTLVLRQEVGTQRVLA
ncbi:hypothetical protein CB1_000538004 [Camelus ferus]|nr:hypothetical protein CB1_000538004 [Camelus ferus]